MKASFVSLLDYEVHRAIRQNATADCQTTSSGLSPRRSTGLLRDLRRRPPKQCDRRAGDYVGDGGSEEPQSGHVCVVSERHVVEPLELPPIERGPMTRGRVDAEQVRWISR